MGVIRKKRRLGPGEDMPPMSPTDKRFLAALAALWLVVGLAGEVLEGGGNAAPPPVDKPPVDITWEAPLEEPRLLEAITLQMEPDPYREDVPLDRELQSALWEACEANGVPVSLALGLIEEESHFQTDVVSSKGAYGLCQLNPRYFPADLTPAENIAAGVAWLGELLERHGDPAAALRTYNLGWDDGDRVFADAVLAAAERWED